jgi:hypothetical protein
MAYTVAHGGPRKMRGAVDIDVTIDLDRALLVLVVHAGCKMHHRIDIGQRSAPMVVGPSEPMARNINALAIRIALATNEVGLSSLLITSTSGNRSCMISAERVPLSQAAATLA